MGTSGAYRSGVCYGSLKDTGFLEAVIPSVTDDDVVEHRDPDQSPAAASRRVITIARILKAHGLSPVPERPTSWQTLLRAHWGAIAAADFFTTEVWTWRGLVTYYAVFVIDLASRLVQILGSTPHPNAGADDSLGGTPPPARLARVRRALPR